MQSYSNVGCVEMIEIDVIEHCVNCDKRFWSFQKPPEWCMFCDMLKRAGEI